MAFGSWTFSLTPAGEQCVDQHQAGASRMSSVPGLKASPHKATVKPCKFIGEVAADFFHQHRLLAKIDLMDRVHDAGVDAVCRADGRHRLHVLGKAASAVANAGEEEGEADAAVVAHAAADFVDVGPVPLADVGQFIDEADLRRQQAIGS